MTDLFLTVLNVCITASYVIAAVLLARLFIRNAPKKFSYMLWAVVLFRLICPVSFSSEFSVFNLKPFDMTEVQRSFNGALTYIPNKTVSAQTPGVTTGVYAINTFIKGNHQDTSGLKDDNPRQLILFIASVLWFAGVLAMLTYGIISYFRVKRIVANAVLANENVYECDKILSPFVLGIFTPRIYIPFRLAEKERTWILTHERYHIKRMDHIVKLLSFLLLSVYWFNPLVWAAYMIMCRDMEMSCDEKVLSVMGEDIKSDYCTSLLAFAGCRSLKNVASPLAFVESEAKRRIKNVLNYKKSRITVSLTVLLMITGVMMACAANPPKAVNNSDLYSAYEFGENLYTNPLSSVFPVKEYMPYYSIIENALIIDPPKNDVQKGIVIEFCNVSVGEDEFISMDSIGIGGLPDISHYKERLLRAKSSDIYTPQYRLYQMDNEIWLVQISGEYIWSIYSLIPIESLPQIIEEKENTVPQYEVSDSLQTDSEAIVTPVIEENQFLSIEAAIRNGLINDLNSSYAPGELSVEGHTVLGSDENDIGIITAYVLMRQINYQFQDGMFVEASDNGIHPVVITVQKNKNGTYSFIELKEPIDGGMWKQSIEEMFPKEYLSQIWPPDENIEAKANIEAQINGQIEYYLKTIGREGSFDPSKEHKKTFLDVDRKMLELLEEKLKYDTELELLMYPYWKGTCEYLADGVRYIYETKQSKSTSGNDQVIYEKRDSNGSIINTLTFEMIHGELVKL